MVLELKGGEIKDSIFPALLVKKAFGEKKIKNVIISGNEIILNSDGKSKFKEPDMGQLPFEYDFSLKGGISRLKLSMPNTVNFDAIFDSRGLRHDDFDKEYKGGFHERADQLFGTRKYSPVIDKDPILDDFGLGIGDIMEVDLMYYLPVVLWRALPQKIIEKITAFEFGGLFSTITYPNGYDFGRRNFSGGDFKEILLTLNNGTDYKRKDQIFGAFKEKILSTELAKFKGDKTKGLSKEAIIFTVNPSKILTYDSLQRLEDITRLHIPEGGKIYSGSSEVYLKIKGMVPRDIFASIHPILDSVSITNSIHYGVGGNVKLGNITLEHYLWNAIAGVPDLPLRIMLRDANIEKIEGLKKTGALAGSHLTLKLKGEKSDKYPICSIDKYGNVS